jgi:hypothetical protein
VLLLDPESTALKTRAGEISESAESLANGILLTKARLRELSDRCDVAVYWYTTVPTWRIIRVDETMFVGVFGASWEGHESATYKISKVPGGPLFGGFERMFDSMIDNGERVV